MPVTSTQRQEIQGKPIGSTWELLVAYGLEFLGWDYLYQAWFLGGRILKGGQVIDFLVYTMPLSTPLYVYGDYWHGGPKKDQDTLARATLFNFMGGQLRKPEVLSGEQLADIDTTVASLFKMFGRGPNPSVPIPATL